METIIRSETTDDIPAIYRVNKLAFERENEAQLVDKLREDDAVILSLVAVLDGQIVGHILFSPVTIIDDDDQWQAVGLGPMAILPELQNQGIGSALIRTGLNELKKLGRNVVIVLGHPKFYTRFGFEPSRPLGIQWEVDVPEDVFMVTELRKGALNGRRGIVRYHSAFNGV